MYEFGPWSDEVTARRKLRPAVPIIKIFCERFTHHYFNFLLDQNLDDLSYILDKFLKIQGLQRAIENPSDPRLARIEQRLEQYMPKLERILFCIMSLLNVRRGQYKFCKDCADSYIPVLQYLGWVSGKVYPNNVGSLIMKSPKEF